MSTIQKGELNFTKANENLGVYLGNYWNQRISSYTQESCNAEKIYTIYSDFVLEMCINTPTPLILTEVLDATMTGIFKEVNGTHFQIILDESVDVPAGTYTYLLSAVDALLIKRVAFTGTIEFIQGAC